MRVGDAFPSRFLKPEDLNGARPVVTIARVTKETIGEDARLVVHFENRAKGLVLNKTNAATIAEILDTDETDAWSGGRIRLYPTKVDFQGRRVAAIRVEVPDGPKPAAPVQDDDDVPF